MKKAFLAAGILLASGVSQGIDLVGYWTFDADGIATVGPDLTIGSQASITTLDSAVGAGALSLTGINNDDSSAKSASGYADISGTTARTIAFWIKAGAQLETVPTMISWGANTTGARFDIRLTGTKLRTEVQGSGVDGTIGIVDSTWHHVVVTWASDGDTAIENAIFYVDGVRDTHGTASTAVNTGTANPLRVGNGFASADRNFTGLIDDLRIYNDVMTISNVNRLVSSYAAGILDSAPTAYWRFEEPAAFGTMQDVSGNGHDSTSLLNGTQGLDGSVGKALAFTNNGTATASLQLNPAAGSFSIEVLARFNTVGGGAQRGLLSQLDGGGTGRSLLYLDDTGLLSTYLGGSTTSSSFTPDADTWYQLVMTVEDGAGTGGKDVIRFYANGVYVGGGEKTAEDAFGDWIIGSHKNGTSQFMDGEIDELAVYDRLLTDTEILDHLNLIPEPGTVGLLALALPFLGRRRRE